MSYGRNDDTTHRTTNSKISTYGTRTNDRLSWLKEEGLITGNRICDVCHSEMNWVKM